jgi:hypothetical protein
MKHTKHLQSVSKECEILAMKLQKTMPGPPFLYAFESERLSGVALGRP